MSQELYSDLRVRTLNVTEVADFNDKRVKGIGQPVEIDDCLRQFEIEEVSTSLNFQVSTIDGLLEEAAGTQGIASLWATYPAVANPTLQNSSIFSSAGFGLNVSTLSSQSMSFAASRLPCTLSFNLTGISSGHIYNSATMPLVAQSTYNTFLSSSWTPLSTNVDYLLKLSSVSDFNAVASTFSSLARPISTIQGELNGLSSILLSTAQYFSTLRASGGSGQCSSLATAPLSTFTYSAGINPIVLPGNQTTLFRAGPVILAGCNGPVQYTTVTSAVFGGVTTAVTLAQAPQAAGGYITMNALSNTCATAEGRLNVAGGNFVSVEGASNLAGTGTGHVEGLRNILYNATLTGFLSHNHIEGACNILSQQIESRGVNHIEGLSSVMLGSNCQYEHMEGFGHNLVSGDNNHIEGYMNSNVQVTVGLSYNHIEGACNINTNSQNHIEGVGHVVNGGFIHIEGRGHTTTLAQTIHAHGLSNSTSNNIQHVEGTSNSARAFANHMMGRYAIDVSPADGAGATFTNSGGAHKNAVGTPVPGGNQYMTKIQRVQKIPANDVRFGSAGDIFPGNLQFGNVNPVRPGVAVAAQHLIVELVGYEKNNNLPTPVAGDGVFMAEYHVLTFTDNRGTYGAINSAGGFAPNPSTLLCTPLWTAGRLTNGRVVNLVMQTASAANRFDVWTPTFDSPGDGNINWALKVKEIDLLRAV
jgi:hypothetical protein